MSANTSESPSTQDSSDTPPQDTEGLLLSYDVIISGTGLVQSILASALARCGKTILHCDGHDYYGEYDAVVPLDYHWDRPVLQGNESSLAKDTNKNDIALVPRATLTLHSSHSLTEIPLEPGIQVMTPYGIGEIQTISATSLSIRLHHWTLANGQSPTLFVGLDPEANLSTLEYLHTCCKIQPIRLLQAQQLLAQRFSFDLTPSLLFASGPAVQGLVSSHVADYLDFKSMLGLQWCTFDKETSSNHISITRVPCSKQDVFATTLLSPLDKRKLMKFLQLTQDYATLLTSQSESSSSMTDKDTTTTVDTMQEVQSLNEKHLHQGRSLARPQNKAVSHHDLDILRASLDTLSFDDYLLQHAKLSPSLRSLVQHALALQVSKETSTRAAMAQLGQHVQALGRYGTTAFLIPLFGSGELSQSFCRSAAVHGGTYLLRRPANHVLVDEHNTVKGIDLGGEGDILDKNIGASHVVVPQHALPFKKEPLWLSRRISIVQGKALGTVSNKDDEQRHVLIIPPNEVNNEHVIHGIVLDDSVQICPSGCTILHLTTTTLTKDDESTLERAIQLLQVKEIYHISFSYPLPQADKDERQSDVPKGLHVCQCLGQSLVVDEAFDEAKRIFQEICPGQEFLALSQDMDTMIQERMVGRDDDNDEERMALEHAINMIEVTKKQIAADEVTEIVPETTSASDS